MTPLAEISAPRVADLIRTAREAEGLTVRELARRAGVAHSQISRLEAGQVAKPSREALVAIARGLDRNPNLLLIVTGHTAGEAARDSLRTLFREGSELAEMWSGCSDVPIDVAHAAARGRRDEKVVQKIAADAFLVQESDETTWNDSYTLAAASGEQADELRELMDIWRYVGSDLRQRWLEYGRQLRRIADLDYLANAEIADAETDAGGPR